LKKIVTRTCREQKHSLSHYVCGGRKITLNMNRRLPATAAFCVCVCVCARAVKLKKKKKEDGDKHY